MGVIINEVDKLEILTLQDNYVDLLAGDSGEILQRARPFKRRAGTPGGLEVSNSVLAEHGFSALVTATTPEGSRSMLFDFGFSDHGAAFNADALNVDLKGIEALALSHGHLDHVGGLKQLVDRVGRRGVELVLHPTAFRSPRYLKLPSGLKIALPSFTREKAWTAGVEVTETKSPYPLLGEGILFLGEIPRKTPFERGMPNAYYEDDGEERWDPIEDDTAIVAHVRGRGLVVLSGCAHAGIVNTVEYARETTGVDQVLAVMGGFHLTGPGFAGIIEPTTEALKAMDPTYVVPTHCTGREAILHVEQEMPDRFLLNMAGTKLSLSA
jgi:7,8-dihydropterin-6-yl-methyl-4-(beta-D-ribofuranosyl)aminobenzene 5'-phosphate synthase